MSHEKSVTISASKGPKGRIRRFFNVDTSGPDAGRVIGTPPGGFKSLDEAVEAAESRSRDFGAPPPGSKRKK